MQKMIEVKALSKKYNAHLAVDQLSFHVLKGETFGLLGENGAGKTTAIECILGTKTWDNGQITLLGQDMQHAPKEIFEKIGVQFQESHFQDQIRVSELVTLTESLYAQTADSNELLKAFGLFDKQQQMVKQLSGGERQRLFVVLALIPKPELVFLDELTTGLDTKARLEVWRYLKTLKQSGLTLLLTSHFMDEVEALCDRICILSQGRQQFVGTIDELCAQTQCETLEKAYLKVSGGEGIQHA